MAADTLQKTIDMALELTPVERIQLVEAIMATLKQYFQEIDQQHHSLGTVQRGADNSEKEIS